MKKYSLRLVSLLLSAAMLSSCFSNPSEEETATLPPLTTVSPIDPETGEPIRILPAETAVLSLEPQSVSGNYVKTDSTFRVKTREDLDESELSALLSIQPAGELRVTKNAACDYTLDCGTLPKGEIVKVMLGDGRGNTVNSWGFQTEDEFRVLSTFPSNLSTIVFPDTGIEISLSAQADLSKAGDYFEISPSVSGKFTNYSTTLVFVPNKPLENFTNYTVRVKAGLPSSDGTALAEDTVFSFRTREGNNSEFCYAMNGISESYLPGDPVVIDIANSDGFLGREFDLKLYRYPDFAAYRQAIVDYNAETDRSGEYTLPTEGLSTVMDEKMSLQYSERANISYYGYGKKSAFVLPDDLEEGWYLADLLTELDGVEYRIQRLIQISPLSVYAAVLSGEAIFFLNDSETGGAAKNAEISLTVDNNEFGAKTDADGVAFFEYWTDEQHYGVLEIRYGDRVFCDRITCVSDRELTPAEKYYMYLFTDRNAYLTTDTVRFWGAIVPRSEETPAPSELTVKLGNTNNDGFSTAVSVSADGTFTGEIHFERHADRWWEPLTMIDGENELFSTYVQVRDYEKPTYILDPVLPEMIWMPQENGITAGARLTYYDGTPAVGKTVMIGSTDAKEGDEPTDENGYTQRTIKNGSDFSRSPSEPWQHCTVQYQLAGIEDDYRYTYATTVGFTRDIGLDVEQSQAEDGAASLALSAYRVNFGENIKTNNYKYYAEPIKETYMGAPADLTVTATIQRNWYVKTENGSYYDYIQKKQVTTYRYGTMQEKIGTYTTEVKNGVGAFENLPTTDPDSWYHVTLTWEDSGGRPMSNSFYFSNTNQWSDDTDLLTYRFFYKEDYEMPYRAEIGETRKYGLEANGVKIPDSDFTGRIFYMVHQDRALLTGISDRNEFTVTMREEYIPNIKVIAAYFDGRHVYAVEGSRSIIFSPESREIGLEIETDQPSYAPAETAEVHLTAKTADGKPIPNAHILLSVVDEAAFSIAQQDANPLATLYRNVFYPDALLYASYIQHTMDNNPTGGDGGGADEGSIRKKFVDTACFTEGVTDANGTLTLSVELPDNVTSWRFTAVAIAKYNGGRLYAGTERLNVSATLPVFVTPIMVTEYAEGDDVVFTASCAGDPNAEITAQVDGDGFSKTLNADADGEFDFGKLPLGEYTVLFRAESDLGSDAAEYPFRVVGARLTSRIEREFDPGEAIDISPAAWPVTLNFYNQDVALYAEILNTLLCTNGTNLDYRIAREYVAAERGWSEAETFRQTVRAATASGGASLYPYAESDRELTALLCAAFPNDVDRSSLSTWLRNSLSHNYCETQDEVVSCYLGLAALDYPVLNEIRHLLEENTVLSGGERLKLCAALALLGDRNTALKYYLEITENLVLYQKDGEVYAYYSEHNSENSDEIQGDTRLALLAASVLNLPEAESMARWINRQKHREYGCALERVVFLKYYKPALTLSATLGYTAGGEEKTEKIDNFYGISLTFGEEQFRNADFKALSGNIGCTAVYEGKSDELSGTPTLTVTKTVTPEEGSEAGKPGAIYRVELSVEGEGKYFTIEDMIPSNARFLYAKNLFDGGGKCAFVSNDDGRQDVTISLSNVRRATYYIRQITKGEAVLEGAVAYNTEGDYGVAEKDIFNKN